MVSCTYLRLLILLWQSWSSLWFIQPGISHDLFCIEFKKWGDNIHPYCTPLPVLNQSIVPYLVETFAFWLTGFSGAGVWSGIPLFLRIFQFVVIHTVKGLSVVNEAEVDAFLEFSYLLYDPMNVVNLISGSSAFSKFNLCIWKFSVHVLLKPSLKNFEHYFASMWNECNCTMIWTFFGIALLWD